VVRRGAARKRPWRLRTGEAKAPVISRPVADALIASSPWWVDGIKLSNASSATNSVAMSPAVVIETSTTRGCHGQGEARHQLSSFEAFNELADCLLRVPQFRRVLDRALAAVKRIEQTGLGAGQAASAHPVHQAGQPRRPYQQYRRNALPDRSIAHVLDEAAPMGPRSRTP
jgi:hypothetical protein